MPFWRAPAPFPPAVGATLADGRDYIEVATTRPETMLADMAVAVHPEDERYTELIGKHAILPLVGRRILIVADEVSDPDKGSGAVKVTPAHDFTDFEIGNRHGLPRINIFDKEGNLSLVDNEDYLRGLPEGALMLAEELHNVERYAARKKIVARLEDFGFLEKIEPNTHVVPHGDRSGVVIEPYLTDQWYVDAKTLAQPAIAAVRSGETTFVPKNWEKTYFDWMENIQPWCISRQLWWGHQIPAWYGPEKAPGGGIILSKGTLPGHMMTFVEETEAEVRAAAESYYQRRVEFVDDFAAAAAATLKSSLGSGDDAPVYVWRDTDVLDTWFSSGLWPFSTLGWPEQSEDLRRFYPTSVLVTMFDIIFFWVARMMMFGTRFMEKAPFAKVLIHARVVDEKGQKMSKTKGNVIDPLTLIDQYGADALRFGLAIAAAQGKDVRMGPARVEGYRNFCTKLWNAARFCEMNACDPVAGFDPASAADTINRWIVGETVKTERLVREALEAFRFNDAATALYQFVWNTYCDWYVELIKPALMGADGALKDETRATAAWALDQILSLMHPFTPYITEELWAKIGERAGGRDGFLMLSAWPSYPAGLVDEAADRDMNAIIEGCTAIRSVRSLLNVPPGAQVNASIELNGRVERAVIEQFAPLFARLAKTAITFEPVSGEATASAVVSFGAFVLDLTGHIDKAKELARLKKDAAKQDGEIAKIDAKLANADFVARAPEEVIEEQKERREAAAAIRDRLNEAIARLG